MKLKLACSIDGNGSIDGTGKWNLPKLEICGKMKFGMSSKLKFIGIDRKEGGIDNLVQW